MNIFLSHHTALQLIRRSRLLSRNLYGWKTSLDTTLIRMLQEKSEKKKTSLVVPNDADMVSAKIFEDLGLFESLHLNEPIHCICSIQNRSRTKRITCHGIKVSPRSFIRVTPHLLVARPEAVFVQMASYLSDIELVLLGYELCGTYIGGSVGGNLIDQNLVDENSNSDGVMMSAYSLKPVMSVRSLTNYMSTLGRTTGIRKAQRAASNILDAAASPMEARLAMMLIAPSRSGGYGLPHPALNHHIDVSRKSASGKSVHICDYYWSDHRFAIEYDSLAFHNAKDNISRDAVRRNELLGKGITVFSLTTKQLMNFELLNNQVRIVGKHLKHRFSFDLKTTNKRIALHKQLFY